MHNIDDGDYVYAVQVRSVDPPQFVAETEEDLDGKIGEYLGLEQCDGCGNHTFRVAPGNKRGFVVVCETDPNGDPEFRHPEPCGHRWPVRLERAGDTVF